MMNRMYYLNGSGSRWVIFKDGKKERVKFTDGKTEYSRAVDYYEAFGNFASVNFRFKGKRISALENFELNGVKYQILSANENPPPKVDEAFDKHLSETMI